VRLAALAIPAGVAFAVCALALLLLARFAHRLKLLDAPGSHKTHDAHIPNVGGLAIVVGALAGLALLPQEHGPGMLATAMFALLGVGLVDDLQGLSPRMRFVAQIVAALVLAAWAGALLRDLGELLWPGRVAALGFAAWPVTVFCFVGVLNATNMIDGIDGLAGGLVLLALAGMGWFAWRAGAHVELAVLACVAAATLPFFAANAPIAGRARVFLGNGGSLVLGCVVAWAVIRLSQGPTRAFAPVTGLWLFAVPLIDTVSVMWRRLAERISPFMADHSHVHHLLMRSGRSARATWLLLLAAGMFGAAIGVAGELSRVPEAARFAAFMTVAFAYHAWARRLSAKLPTLAEVRGS